mgnify:CR=1 FL=1
MGDPGPTAVPLDHAVHAGPTPADLAEFARALASLPERYAVPIRIEHPANAVFDVVVMQSSADPAFARPYDGDAGQMQ